MLIAFRFFGDFGDFLSFERVDDEKFPKCKIKVLIPVFFLNYGRREPRGTLLLPNECYDV